MLVLTRKPDQRIEIGNDIVLTVVRVRGDRVRIGIEAPPEIRIIRPDGVDHHGQNTQLQSVRDAQEGGRAQD
ncbi:MAG: carbon storage regulator [Rubripirellula sp.]